MIASAAIGAPERPGAALGNARRPRDKEVVAFREHFFSVNDVPHLVCVMVWQDALVSQEDVESARSLPTDFDRDGLQVAPVRVRSG